MPRDMAAYKHYERLFIDACNHYNDYDSRVRTYQSQRNQIVKEINQYDAKIRQIREAINKVNKVLNMQSAIHTRFSKVENKTAIASANYSQMVSATGITNKNLEQSFGTGTSEMKSKFSSLFENVKTKKAGLEKQLSTNNECRSNAKKRLENTDYQLRVAKSERSSWSNKKWRYYWAMVNS